MSRAQFLFVVKRGDQKGQWRKYLQTTPCEHIHRRTKRRCNRSTVIGIGHCWQHLRSDMHLQVKNAYRQNAEGGRIKIGKGLFAVDRALQDGEQPIFNPGDEICGYEGELISKETLENRYGKYTAPYGAKITESVYEDGALHRGVGTLCNHEPENTANARIVINDDEDNDGPKRGRLFIQAIKPIYHGEEITVTYAANEHASGHSSSRSRSGSRSGSHRSYRMYEEDVRSQTFRSLLKPDPDLHITGRFADVQLDEEDGDFLAGLAVMGTNRSRVVTRKRVRRRKAQQ